MKVLKFPFSKKDYSKIKQKNNICINVFCYENSLNYPVYVSNEKFIDCMDLSMITGENKSHYVYKDFDRFMCNYTKNKNKDFCKYCLQCLSSERVLVEHKETCLEINGKQTVKLRWDSSKFKNHFKQLVATFEIYVDFESPLKGVRGNDKNNSASYTEKSQNYIPCSFAYKVVCVNDRFNKPLVLYRGKSGIHRFIKEVLQEYDYCKNIIKKTL